MGAKVTIHGKEITNPVARIGLALFGAFVAAVVMALALFVILPLVGVVVTVSLGSVVVVLGACLIGSLLVGLVALFLSAVFGPLSIMVGRVRKSGRE